VEKIDAQKVFGYALFKDGKHTRLSYSLEKFHSDVAGRSFHNGRFIQRMRDKAGSLPKYVFSSIVNLCMWQCPLKI
jgi:squalene monooxygenase